MTTLYCPHCEYNLTGLPENRCPECGNAFDPEALQLKANTRMRPGLLVWHFVAYPVAACLPLALAAGDFQIGDWFALISFACIGIGIFACGEIIFSTPKLWHATIRTIQDSWRTSGPTWWTTPKARWLLVLFVYLLQIAVTLGGFLIILYVMLMRTANC